MPDHFGAMVVWGIVLIAGLLLAVRDLRRQTGPTDSWSHEVYRPARRPRPPRFHLRPPKLPKRPGWSHWHDDYQ